MESPLGLERVSPRTGLLPWSKDPQNTLEGSIRETKSNLASSLHTVSAGQAVADEYMNETDGGQRYKIPMRRALRHL